MGTINVKAFSLRQDDKFHSQGRWGIDDRRLARSPIGRKLRPLTVRTTPTITVDGARRTRHVDNPGLRHATLGLRLVDGGLFDADP